MNIRRSAAYLLAAAVIFMLFGCERPPRDVTTSVTTAAAETTRSTTSETTRTTAVPPEPHGVFARYLGVSGYGRLSAEDVMRDGAVIYRFAIDGEERLFSVKNSEGFPIQNLLMEGYDYELTLEGSEVAGARPVDPPENTRPRLAYTPGERTLKNFLTAAFAPMGSTLYIYGGNWDWQDEGASPQARSIGVSGTWKRFFDSQNADYEYKDAARPGESTYPFGGWNQYYYAGTDCSGFVGWTVYNTLETESGREGYVFPSRRMAKIYAEGMGLGSFLADPLEDSGDLRPGDIVSMPGHAWICLGVCEDGSVLLIHSTVSKSVSGKMGGGVQLSALDPSGGNDCRALELARDYTEKYFPEWAERYPAVMKSYSEFLEFERDGVCGVFRWSDAVLTDPDGVGAMSAREVMKMLFGE